MFKKLLSNLPFNPSLIGQVSFYAKRLHTEASVRRAGFAMIALTMLLQMFAVFSPPQASLQASPNTDLINGGFSRRDEAVSYCRNNTQDYQKILGYFGITCQNVADSVVTSIHPHDYDNNLRSMGRLAYGVQGETPIRIPDVGVLYSRHFWSLNYESSYKALKVTDSAGRTVFLLFGCGNIVSIGMPTPPPAPKPTPKPTPTPVDVCKNAQTASVTPKCDVCPKISGIQTNVSQCKACSSNPNISATASACKPCALNPSISADDSGCTPCSSNPTILASDNTCKPCEQAQTRTDLTACLVYEKQAKNLTENISNANGTTAQANDVIEYTLTTTNSGNLTIKGYQVSDGIGDILDYADVVDLHGGTMDSYDTVSWPKEDIKGKQTATHTITVKVKSVIPQTPASSSDPNHFDMVMTNVYGNTIEINLPKTPAKAVEIATTKELVNTGPGTSLLIGFSITMIIGYFFARSRLLAKELDIVRADFGSTGGY